MCGASAASAAWRRSYPTKIVYTGALQAQTRDGCGGDRGLREKGLQYGRKPREQIVLSSKAGELYVIAVKIGCELLPFEIVFLKESCSTSYHCMNRQMMNSNACIDEPHVPHGLCHAACHVDSSICKIIGVCGDMAYIRRAPGFSVWGNPVVAVPLRGISSVPTLPLLTSQRLIRKNRNQPEMSQSTPPMPL
jgi:hypothetical protein